jgi:hypothetical protein
VLIDATVLITGASSGIGAACAAAFAKAGARLVLCARRRDRLEAIAGDLDTEVELLELDVRDRQSVTAALGERDDVDVLVNNAGLASGFAPLHTAEPDDWDRMIDTNVKGVLNVIHAVVPGMVERGRGHVINLGSIAGAETYPNGAVYCATKAALDRITTGLRMDLLGTGVRVSSVDPGLVETEFSVVRFHGDADRAAQVYEGMTPLTADDIADAVVWVADRPPQVQITQVVMMPTDQASATRVHRRGQ